ncbi:hypothetical protein ABTZ59_28085 [Streptomyces sp. NPDC094034]|uniref:hypothetical protein n=1 Tax=Streptomyces sp. NPDC094034 TaxID=3155309 RepID=UPI00331DA7D3
MAKKKTRLRLRNVDGHVKNATARMVATLHSIPENEPLEGEDIEFYTGDGDDSIGSARTNDRGEAELNPGNNYLQPLKWGRAIEGGVSAEYFGSAEYQSHPRVRATMEPGA